MSNEKCSLQTDLAFRRMFGLFAGKGASLVLKVRFWNTLVCPVLLYGCGTWGLTAVLINLEAVCTTLMALMSDGKLSVALAHQQWGYASTIWHKHHCPMTCRLSLLGHCLRLPRDTPDQKAVDLTVNNILNARQGRLRTCLLRILRSDLEKVGMNLRRRIFQQLWKWPLSVQRWQKGLHNCAPGLQWLWQWPWSMWRQQKKLLCSGPGLVTQFPSQLPACNTEIAIPLWPATRLLGRSWPAITLKTPSLLCLLELASHHR